MTRRKSRRTLFYRFKRWVKGVGEKMGAWLAWPLNILFLPFQITKLFHDRGQDVNKDIRTRKGKSRNKWLNWLSAPVRFLGAPVTLIRLAFRKKTQGMLLYFVPAVLTLMVAAFVWYQVSFRSHRVQERYFLGARRAMSARNIVLAKKYFRRLMDRETLSPEQALQWAFILQETGDEDVAQDLIAKIAPDSEAGYPPAHAARAIELAKAIELKFETDQTSPSQELLAQLRYHLDNANSQDERIHVAEATYHQHQSDVKKAITEFAKIAEKHPRFFLTIADLAEQNGMPDEANNALQESRLRFQLAIGENANDHLSRVLLANTLVRLERAEEAEKILLAGIGDSVVPEPSLSRALADLYGVVAERKVREMIETGEVTTDSIKFQYEMLKNGITRDASYTLPHVRLVDWLMLAAGRQSESYDKKAVHDRPSTFRIEALCDMLAEQITSDSSSALDHATFAYLKHLDDDSEAADWHLNQTFKLDSEFGRFGRLLAIALAYREHNHDVDWALDLGKRSFEKFATDPDAQHAYGMVLLQANHTERAIQLLEDSLEAASFPGEVHQALSTAYLSIGKPMKAAEHEQEAQAIRIRERLTKL